MSRQGNAQQAMEHILEAVRLIEQNKSDIDSQVDYMKGHAQDSGDFRKLSEQYECHEGALEGLQKALYNLGDIVW